MIRVGLIGEDPNDTSAIKNLLEKRYKKKFQFVPLVRRIKGSQLDGSKIRSALPIEFADNKCKFVIYIRDLDGFKSESSKVKVKTSWFNTLDSTIKNKGILLLNIWELEALILGDIETFNKIYKTNHRFKKDPMHEKNPKETLKNFSVKSAQTYHESHCPDIFKQLDIDNIKSRVRYFDEFIAE